MERRPFEDHANKRPRVVSPLREQQVWHAAPAVINQKRCAQSMPTCLELDRPAAPSGKLARMHQRQGDPVDSLVQQSREVARDTFAATSCECCGTPYEVLERRGSPRVDYEPYCQYCLWSVPARTVCRGCCRGGPGHPT